MAHKTSILLVEGQGDVDFFEDILRKLQLLDQIDITLTRGVYFNIPMVYHPLVYG